MAAFVAQNRNVGQVDRFWRHISEAIRDGRMHLQVLLLLVSAAEMKIHVQVLTLDWRLQDTGEDLFNDGAVDAVPEDALKHVFLHCLLLFHSPLILTNPQRVLEKRGDKPRHAKGDSHFVTDHMNAPLPAPLTCVETRVVSVKFVLSTLGKPLSCLSLLAVVL